SNWTQVTTPVNFTSPPENGYYFSGKYFVGLDNSTNCIAYTTDNGTTWTNGIGSPAATEVRGFVDLSGNLFSYTKDKGVFKSTDGGVNWVAANTGLTNLKIASMTTIGTKIVLATEGAGVFVSSDNGGNWVQSNSGITGSLNGTFVWTMGANLYFYKLTGNQYYSSNSQGANWIAAVRPSFLQSTNIAITKSIKEIYRNGNNLYMISKTQNGLSINDSVFITNNEGVSWANITDNLPNDVLGAGLTEFGGNLYIAYGSVNLGIYKRAVSTTVGITENNFADLLRIYPNPFNDKIVLSNFSNEKIKQVFIYDNLGKLIKSENGDAEYINTDDLDRGLYFMQIVFSDNSTVKKKLMK
ncbi:MAG TPA: T9SS type A sorting domain-containing protein, partial [Bacteroidia bacterium]|nr:T9SS type A sorting domain-containing protein [Bacteroidia bacterium]